MIDVGNRSDALRDLIALNGLTNSTAADVLGYTVDTINSKTSGRISVKNGDLEVLAELWTSVVGENTTKVPPDHPSSTRLGAVRLARRIHLDALRKRG